MNHMSAHEMFLLKPRVLSSLRSLRTRVLRQLRSLHTCVRNGVDLVPLARKDDDMKCHIFHPER